MDSVGDLSLDHKLSRKRVASNKRSQQAGTHRTQLSSLINTTTFNMYKRRMAKRGKRRREK